MATLVFAPTPISRIASFLFDRSHDGTADTPEQNADDVRASRDFMSEMILDNPQAFANELDVQNMMYFFPGRL